MIAAAVCLRSREATFDPVSKEIGIGSFIPAPFGGSNIRRKSLSNMREIISARVLTHSIEVAQVARTIAGALGLNQELVEAVSLAHDLGHPPFGHTGEEALDAEMKAYGGFDHNAQAIRIVTSLEQHYAQFDGLNLTWECLEGIAKHNGPVPLPHPPALRDYNRQHDLELHSYASAEAQVAALADDVAYNNHDLHDGLRAGVFSDAQAEQLPIVGPGLCGGRSALQRVGRPPTAP